MENAKKCIEEALDSLNICTESGKIILKEKQERAVKELISGNDTSDMSSLHDFEILRFVTNVHLPFSVGSLDLSLHSCL